MGYDYGFVRRVLVLILYSKMMNMSHTKSLSFIPDPRMKIMRCIQKRLTWMIPISIPLLIPLLIE